MARPGSRTGFDQKRVEGTEEQTCKILVPRARVFAVGPHELPQLIEDKRGNGGVFAARDRALEFPHQQRLRLRRKLTQIVPQPLGRCLAHAPDLHVSPRERRAHRPQ